MCGVLVFDSVSRRLLLLLPPSLSSTHSLSTHSLSTHSLSTHSLSTHSLSTHSLSTHTQHFVNTHFVNTHTHTLCQHTLCQHTLCQYTLCQHTLCPHTLCQHTLCPHTLCQHTLCPQTLCQHTLCPHTLCQHTHTHTFHAAGVAHCHRHNVTSTVVLRGRRGTYGTGWRAWSGLVARDAAALCVAGVAQPHIHRRFTWQAWHNFTSTFVLRGRRGTDGTGWRAWSGLVARDAAALCVAGVAQPHIHFRFTWQAWHNVTSTVVLRGRRGTYGTGWRAWSGLVARDAAALCVAGVAQPHIHRRFTWQAWHNFPPSFHVAGVAQLHIHLRFAWQAWDRWHWVARFLVARDAAALCVAGVAQPHIHFRFTWQAWHNVTSTVVLRGRRGTYGTGWRAWSGLVARDAAALCVAGVAQPHIHRGACVSSAESVRPPNLQEQLHIQHQFDLASQFPASVAERFRQRPWISCVCSASRFDAHRMQTLAV